MFIILAPTMGPEGSFIGGLVFEPASHNIQRAVSHLRVL